MSRARNVANLVPLINSSADANAITIDGNEKVTLAGDLQVDGTTTTIDTEVTVSDAMVINNAGSDVGLKINSTSSGNIMQLQDSGSDVLVVADGGTTTGTFAGTITGSLVGNASGTAATVTAAAQPAIQSLGTLTALAGGTGDFNWDSNTLTVDSSESRVGIGCADPANNLEVRSAGQAVARIQGVDQYTCGLKLRNNHSSVQSDWNLGAVGGSSGWGGTNGNFIIRDDTTNSTAIEFERGAGGATGALYIDSDSNVGIGTDAPEGDLHLSESGASEVRFQMTNSNTSHAGSDGFAVVLADNGEDTYLWQYESSGNFNFGTANTSRMVIDSSGRVGIGSSPGSQNVQGDDLVVGDGSGDRGITIYSGSGSGDTGNLFFSDSGNAVQAGISYDQGDNKMLFRVSDANKMEIQSNGRVNIASAIGNDWITKFTNSDTGAPYGIHVLLGGNPNNNTTHYFMSGNDAGGQEFVIYSDGSYTQVSDRRLKENIVDVESMLDKVNSLRVVNYNRIHDDNKRLHIGAIAQEVEEIFPHLINIKPAKDAVEEVTDEEGNITTEAILAQDERYMMYKVGLVFPLIKAVQELSAKNNALEARILTLESA